MKNLFLFIVTVLIGLQLQAQELPIKFKANEKADTWIGKDWDFSYEKLKSPINIEFDGINLKMYHDTGKNFFEKEIINYQYKENKEYDKIKNKVYILEAKNKHNLIEYMVIKISYSYGDVIYEIILPFMDQTGEVMSYSRYQQF